ncbi:NTP transferase domain-containing protein [Fictibacillus fluitans]|uniref:NTP transferase domain-containing protein n=1 Tax=Fictibacillus fluitans TaxID=3058422 RepID=A0ABT8HQ29_9BACL|nr:NTP transferase domain-containing protein [Fictibacillus sp. NE201]MDN4522878.1 NTP transferase domain-containing protein [Fictibacillus sp. NE201]
MGKITGIYLAAGHSRRMGVNKLALPLKHSNVGSLGLDNALNTRLDDMIVVVKKEDCLDWINPVVKEKTKRGRWMLVRCGAENQGQAESLKTGVRQAIKLQSDAIVIMLADQPFVTAEMIENLMSRYERFNPLYVASRFQGIIQPPVLFSSSVFPALLKLKGDQGARSLFEDYQISPGSFIDYKDERLLFDVDDMKDYKKAKKYSTS